MRKQEVPRKILLMVCHSVYIKMWVGSPFLVYQADEYMIRRKFAVDQEHLKA